MQSANTGVPRSGEDRGQTPSPSPREIRVQATLWATVEGGRGTKQICPVTNPHSIPHSLSVICSRPHCHIRVTTATTLWFGLACISAGVIVPGQVLLGFYTRYSSFHWVYKQMLRWFPRFQVATTCFSCSPPDLNLVVTNFIFCIHVK